MNFGAIKTKVANYLNRQNDFTTLIPEWVVSAQKNLERKYNFRCMEAYTSVVSSSMTLAFPQDYKEIISLKVKLNNMYYPPLSKVSVAEAYELYKFPDVSKARPEVFAELHAQNAFLLRPTPDVSYTFDEHYYKYTTPLSIDSDTNWWTDNAHELLVYGALIEGKGVIEDDAGMVKWNNLYNQILGDLATSEVKANFSGSRIKVNSAYLDSGRGQYFDFYRGY